MTSSANLTYQSQISKLLIFILAPLFLSSNMVAQAADEPLSNRQSYASAAAEISVLRPKLTHKFTSRALDRAEYFPESEEKFMLLYFKAAPQRAYIFRDLSMAQWQEWTAATSPGKWLHQHLHNRPEHRYTPTKKQKAQPTDS